MIFLAPVVGWFAKSALMRSPVGGLLRRVPARVWKILIIAVVVGIIIWRALAWHSGKVEDLRTTAFAAGRQSLAKDMVALRDQLESRNAKAAAVMRSENDAKLRDVAVRHDALRVRGPGAATCSDSAFVSPGSGGHDQAGRPGDGAVSGMPDPRGSALIAVPFAGAVGFSEQHDSFRVEALGWRKWHAHFVTEWEAYRVKAEAAAKASKP